MTAWVVRLDALCPAAPWVRLIALFACVYMGGCATTPPSNINDLCSILREQPGWRDVAMQAESRWGTSPAIALAFIRHESSFKSGAKPPRRKLLGILPWLRPSSAFGYAQATDAAWEDYERASGRRSVRRTDFGDSVDFVGWYNSVSRRVLGLDLADSYSLYLAYHEGHQGFSAGSWRTNDTLKRYAAQVAARARRYALDLRRCP